jgi:hypothetical protein
LGHLLLSCPEYGDARKELKDQDPPFPPLTHVYQARDSSLSHFLQQTIKRWHVSRYKEEEEEEEEEQ